MDALCARDDAVAMLDPRLGPLGRLWVDRDRLEDTQGLHRALLYPTAHPLSVCLLYQNERCTAGRYCNQAHVQRAYMWDLLTTLGGVQDRVCCYHHGDPISHQRQWNQLFEGRIILVMLAASTRRHQAVVLPAPRIALTRYWDGVLEDQDMGPIVLHAAKICQLHAKGRCGWGAECRYIHICREFLHTKIGERLLRPMHRGGRAPHKRSNRLVPSLLDDDLLHVDVPQEYNMVSEHEEETNPKLSSRLHL